jgi:hypothetical protein
MRCLLIIFFVTVAAADELPDAPPGGVDADVTAAVEEARAGLAGGDAGHAAGVLIRLHLQRDRFAKAQLPAVRAQSREILDGAGRALAGAGRRDDAARAFDAAWTLGGRGATSPELARSLVQLAGEVPDRGEKLWLARRARRADPGNAEAARIDDRYSHNSLRKPALAVTIIGVGAAVAGGVLVGLGKNAESELTGSIHPRAQADDLLAQRNNYILGGGITLGVGIAAIAAGAFLLLGGQPHWSPTSPSRLPALPEAP